MKQLVPFTKIITTMAVSLWAIILHTPGELAVLLIAELVLLAVTGLLHTQYKVVFTLAVFAIFLAVVQYIGGGTLESAYVTGLRGLCMTMILMVLLATTRLQNLTTA